MSSAFRNGNPILAFFYNLSISAIYFKKESVPWLDKISASRVNAFITMLYFFLFVRDCDWTACKGSAVNASRLWLSLIKMTCLHGTWYTGPKSCRNILQYLFCKPLILHQKPLPHLRRQSWVSLNSPSLFKYWWGRNIIAQYCEITYYFSVPRSVQYRDITYYFSVQYREIATSFF